MKPHILPLLAAAILARTAPAVHAQGRDAHFVEQIIDPAGAGDCKMLGDIDGDGMLDAVLGGRPGEDLAWYAYPSWTRTLIAPAQTEFTTDGALGDVDNDGDPDVVIPDGESGDNLLWFRNPRPAGNPAAGPWARLTIGAAGGAVKDVDIADFNADGRPDVAARTHTTVFVFFRTQSGGWTRVTIEQGLDGEGMTAADLDLDGDQDLVLPGFWLENPAPAGNPATTPWPRWTIAPDAPIDAKILVADMDGSGDPEVLFSSSEGTAPVRLYDTGPAGPRGPWTGREVVPTLSGCHTLQAADIDRDGDTDLVIAQMHTAPPSEISVVYNDGGALLWRRVPFAGGGLHNGVVADIDGDGDADLFGANWTGHPPARVWLNSPPVCPADADGNGTLDIFDVMLFTRRWIGGPGGPGGGGVTQPGGGAGADFDASGAVNAADLAAFLRAWMIGVSRGC